MDRLYSSDIIMDQYDYYGQFHNGFLNAYFGQRDVTLTTAGWNYIAINDDVYMYTGVTSVTSDQSNIGFILTNQRTKETRFYPCAGATETSAQSSAQSQVQQMRYSATFPLLLNIADQPTYFMALKGEDGLVKMYAMVNVQQYNIVETGQTVAQCEENYRKTLLNNGIIDRADAEVPAEDQTLQETKGTIAEIRSAVIEGTSVYYLRFEGEDSFSVYVSAAQVPEAPLLNVGDTVTVYWRSGTQWITARQIAVENRAVSTPPETPAEEPAEPETEPPARHRNGGRSRRLAADGHLRKSVTVRGKPIKTKRTRGGHFARRGFLVGTVKIQRKILADAGAAFRCKRSRGMVSL